jgi:hypothetical protein
MYSKVKTMHGTPEWKFHKIVLPEVPNEPQPLYHQDIIKCAAFLFQNPDFEDSMDYTPQMVYDDTDCRVFHEMSTGDDWHKVQVCVCIESERA